MSEPSRIPLPQGDSQRLTEVALKARALGRILQSIPSPVSGSHFGDVEREYGLPHIAVHTRNFLDASFEHLTLLADLTAPLRFHPDQVTLIGLRPYYTLARAALESSAHAVWLLGAPDVRELARRHLKLLRWDDAEHSKWQADLAEKERIRLQDAELVTRLAGIFEEADIKPVGGYLEVIRSACIVAGLDPAAVERQWRAASGAAHGKLWPNEALRTDDLSVSAGVRVPDMRAMLDFIENAYTMSQWGVLTLSEWCGADTKALIDEAAAWQLANGTLKDGVTEPPPRDR